MVNAAEPTTLERASDSEVFESIVRRCMEMGLVAGEGFAVDARVIEANASRFQRIEGSEVVWTDAQRASRPVREYLAALDGEHAPTNPERKPKALSPADPAAAWTTRGRHKMMFGYSLNYLIDLANAIIVDVAPHSRRRPVSSFQQRSLQTAPQRQGRADLVFVNDPRMMRAPHSHSPPHCACSGSGRTRSHGPMSAIWPELDMILWSLTFLV